MYHTWLMLIIRSINEVDGPTDTTSSSGRSMLQKRQLFLPFSPLASRGTIYMAFMFLMPLAVINSYSYSTFRWRITN